jgi:hypothetical protein
MEKERFEEILRVRSEVNGSKGGQRSCQYRCGCGYYTGRRYNMDRHVKLCRLNASNQE